MNIDKALEILDKEVTDEYLAEALETLHSWIQAVKDKMNAPLDDEY